MKALFLLLIVTACHLQDARADSFSFPKTLTRREFVFGDRRFVTEQDGRAGAVFPSQSVSIYIDGQLIAQHKGVTFKQMFASESRLHFLGVSNYYHIWTAFVIFDAEGNLIREVKHQFMPFLIYKQASTFVVRKWYDESDPKVEFVYDSNHLRSLFIQGAISQRFDLMEPNLGFSEERRLQKIQEDRSSK